MDSAQVPGPVRTLFSQLLREDAELRDVVEEFVEGLAGRVEELKKAYERMDFDMLTMLAHRLKGAAGSYGYPEISHICSQMEQRFRDHQLNDFAKFISELTSMAEAAKSGLGESLT